MSASAHASFLSRPRESLRPHSDSRHLVRHIAPKAVHSRRITHMSSHCALSKSHIRAWSFKQNPMCGDILSLYASLYIAFADQGGEPNASNHGNQSAQPEEPVAFDASGRLPRATKLGAVVHDAVRRWYLETEKEALRGDVVSCGTRLSVPIHTAHAETLFSLRRCTLLFSRRPPLLPRSAV